jgi:hypothetical protein
MLTNYLYPGSSVFAPVVGGKRQNGETFPMSHNRDFGSYLKILMCMA